MYEMILTVCLGDQQRTINVLLIGETGVDKSTWINAFANYCSFYSLEDAVKAGGLFPIPSTFTITDPQTKQQINISSHGKLPTPTQITRAGESVTRSPNEYVFQHANSHIPINLIDTPGLFDTHDAGTSTHDTDHQRLDNIFKSLSAYQEIHAIFILMKANVTRLSAAFQYTLTDIFKRLDKSACSNVIFIFTNAASSNFKTDETQPILQQFLKDKNLPIALPPEKPTIYCFEQNTVKYLAECKNSIPHDEDDEEDAQRNWNKSVKSTKELVDYICSLEPHSLEVMMSINNANHMVSVTSKLLLNTIRCIFKAVNDMEEKKNEEERMKEETTRHSQRPANRKRDSWGWYIVKTKLGYEALGQTNVVCESGPCSRVVEGRIVHPQVCCEDCMASGFIMYLCSSIGWLGNCRICGCTKSQHSFRSHQIVDRDDALKHVNNEVLEAENRVRIWKDEAQQMIEICAKLNVFAHQNALIGASQTDDELLKCLENEWQTCVRSTDTGRLAVYLTEIQSQYSVHWSKANCSHYGVQDVPKLIEQLCNLPINGQQVKMAVEEYEKSRRKVIETATNHRRNYSE